MIEKKQPTLDPHGLYERALKNDQYIRMCSAAKDEIPAGRYASEQSQILGLAIKAARKYADIEDQKRFRRNVRREVRSELAKQRSGYSFITWQVILWWILPSLIEWFVVWWFKDKGE